MNKIFVDLLPNWCETNLQPAFYDVESGTVLQMIARMYPKVQELNKAFNDFSEESAEAFNNFSEESTEAFNKFSEENIEVVNNYINAFNELHDYVEDYFDNLDVQEEVNIKLNQMAEDGTLQEIVSDYLNTKAVFGYDSVADMKSATNLRAGSYAKTIGYYNKNDGGGASYYIREGINTDVQDEAFIITLTDSNLVAELITENDVVNIRQLGGKSETDTNYSKFDNKPYIDKYMARLDNIAKDKTLSLFIPSGIWCFSETLINRSRGFNIYGEKSFAITVEGNENATVIAPVQNNQKHIWKVGGSASYATSEQAMTYNWNLNNLIFSTGKFIANNQIQTMWHVTKAALYLDAVSAGRSEFLQFDQVDGTGLAICSSWENYFGTLNFRRIYDFSTPAMLFDSIHPVTGAGSPDISSTNIDNMMFEGINGDMIYTADNCNLAELQIGNINAENRLVSLTGTEQGTIVGNNSSKEANHHYSVFNLGRAIGVMVNQIKLGNWGNYRFTGTQSGETHIMDRIITMRENSFTQMCITSIISNGNRSLVTVIYKPETYFVNQRSRIIINNYQAYSETIISGNLPMVDVKFFTNICINNIFDGMGVVNEEIGSIPLYKYAMAGGTNQYIYHDDGADNPLHLCLRRKTTMNQTLAILKANPIYDMYVRIKAKTGVNGRIGYRATEAGGSETYYAGPTYTGNDKWQYVKLNLPELEPNTRLVIADGYSGYASDDDETLFDSITLVPRS